MKTTTNARPAALAAAARQAENHAERAAAVLLRAHDMTRRTLAAFPGADYRVTLAAALRIAWADATAPAAADQWAAMQPEEQVDALTRMTVKAAGRDVARCDAAGNERSDRFAWARNADGILMHEHIPEIVNEAYIRLAGYLADDKNADKPLAALLYQAVIIAAQAINRAERRNARAIRFADITTTDADGRETEEHVARIIDNAAPLAERFTNPEAAAVLHDTISSLARDDLDRRILAGMIDGFSAREIAQHVKKSHTAVNKRIAGIRARYAADHLNDA